MLEQAFRHHYQYWFIDPIANKLNHHITPLQITFTAAITGITAGIALLTEHPYLGVILLLLSGCLDTLDGTVARLQNKCSSIGAVYDILMDRLVEFTIIISLWGLHPDTRALLSLLLLGSILLCVTSFLVVGIFTTNKSDKSFYYSPGIIERAEAFIFFICMMLFPSLFSLFAVLLIILTTLTTIIRVAEFKQHMLDTAL